MDGSDGPVTVIEVTIRDEIGRLLDGSRGAPGRDDIADALRQAGIDDVDGPLVDAAIGHYAETAPIAEADALAEVAMAASPIPFDPDIGRAPGPDSDAGHDADPMDGLDAADGDRTVEPEAEEDPADSDDEPDDEPHERASDPAAPPEQVVDDEFGRGAPDRTEILDDDDALDDEPSDASTPSGFDAGTHVELDADLHVMFDLTDDADEFTIDPEPTLHDDDVGEHADADPSGFDGLE